MKSLTTNTQLKQLDGDFSTVDAARKAFNKRFKHSDIGNWQFVTLPNGKFTVVAEVAVNAKGVATLDKNGKPLPSSAYYQDVTAADVNDIDNFDDSNNDDINTKRASLIADIVNSISWN